MNVQIRGAASLYNTLEHIRNTLTKFQGKSMQNKNTLNIYAWSNLSSLTLLIIDKNNKIQRKYGYILKTVCPICFKQKAYG